ncbi:unnamed protein product [Arctia plantaginis]|uniref:RNA-directed DNA polymerase n=1 Tax=Arctia plantaginis TaxID=874455 RepID=A0A8S0ZB04_ARCPL|nr:unnamed protein product [Arctia plantaginis]
MLSGSERSTLENLLGEYSDTFDIVGEPTPFAEHHIDTGDHPPIALPPYRLTPAKKEIMRAELDKMLAEDVIEECESAWAAPCVLRLIDRFRSGSTLSGRTILGYLDDLLVISEDLESHIADLRAVFERLRMYKLRANREKCVFARDRLKYLGHVISHDGISPDEEKVSAILEMKEPTTLQQLRIPPNLLLVPQVYPEFAKVAEPLTRLTKKSQTWKWGKDQTSAFIQLKTLLASPPILTQPDYSRPFILRTDSSDFALGAALLQGESPQDEHPIECYFQVYSETGWSVCSLQEGESHYICSYLTEDW